jgi:hypothetical protein
MGQAPKLESPADDDSELRDAMDVLIADFVDRRVFDEQVVSDIPESGSDDDDRDDSEKTMNEHLSRLVRETETVDSDTLRATSRMKAYPFDKTSWTQRVLSWIRRD